MKKMTLLIGGIVIMAAWLSCSKKSDPMNAPKPPGSDSTPTLKPALCLIKSFKTWALVNPSPDTSYAVLTYDSNRRITRIDDGALGANKTVLADRIWTFEYSASGQLIKLGIQDGRNTIFDIIQYKNGVIHSIQAADPGTADTPKTVFVFNTLGGGELDQTIAPNPGCPSGTTSYNYGSPYNSGILTSISFFSCTASPLLEYVFKAVPGINSAVSFLNPFQQNTTQEQRFIYFYTRIFGYIVLGVELPLATYETYTYTTGVEKPYLRFNYTYTKDSLNRPNGYIESSAYAENFSPYTAEQQTQWTYECK